MKAYRALPNFRGDSAFYTWMYRIAINTAKNHLVAAGRRPLEVDLENEDGDALDLDELQKDVATPEHLLLTDEIRETVRNTVAGLPDDLRVAITLRESISASHNNWGAMLFDVAADAACFAPLADGKYQPYEIRNIVDRVGGGDAFAAGLLFALSHEDYPDNQQALQFACASSCLAHSVLGDFNFSSRAEVDALMKGSGSGRVVR